MSVILKSREEIRSMTGGLLYHLDLYRDIIEGSKAYRYIESRAGGGEGADLGSLFVCFLMYRVWVANKVAWAVQHGERVNLSEDLPPVGPRDADLEGLAAGLHDLEYNIYTNGGQYWLDRECHRTFERIMWRIRRCRNFRMRGVRDERKTVLQ